MRHERVRGLSTKTARGFETLVRLSCGDRLVSFESDAIQEQMVERARATTSHSLCVRVDAMVQRILSWLSPKWPKVGPVDLREAWSSMLLPSGALDLLGELDERINSICARTWKTSAVWPFCVTRRTPVIVFEEGAQVHLMIRCKRIWHASNSVLSVPWPVCVSNQDSMNEWLEHVRSDLVVFVNRLERRERSAEQRVMDLWDIVGCESVLMRAWRTMLHASLDDCLASGRGDFCIDVRRVMGERRKQAMAACKQ